MTLEKDVLRVPFGEVAKVKEPSPRKNNNKKRYKKIDGRPTHSTKEATMSIDTNKTIDTNKSEQAKAFEPSTFSESLSTHVGEFSTAFSYAAGAVAGGLVIVGIATLVQKGVNAAFGGAADPIDTE